MKLPEKNSFYTKYYGFFCSNIDDSFKLTPIKTIQKKTEVLHPLIKKCLDWLFVLDDLLWKITYTKYYSKHCQIFVVTFYFKSI